MRLQYHSIGSYFFPSGFLLPKSLFSSVQFSHSVGSDSLRPHGLQHARLPCPSPTPGTCSNSCPSSQWCHPTNLILCRPLLLLPSVFPSIRVFSNESALHIRWPKYWSFSFSIRPSNEYLGLISFRIDWFDLHCCPRDSQESSPAPVWRHQFFGAQPFLLSNSHIHTWLLEKP